MSRGEIDREEAGERCKQASRRPAGEKAIVETERSTGAILAVLQAFIIAIHWGGPVFLVCVLQPYINTKIKQYTSLRGKR